MKIKSKKVFKSLREHLVKISCFIHVTMRFGEHNLCVCLCAHMCVFLLWGKIINNRTRTRAKYSI